MLGSSDYGAQLGAHLGLPYAFAWFFTEGRGAEPILALYRNNYKPSTRHPKPHSTICVWALAADTEADAWHHFKSRAHWRLGFERGLREPLMSPEAVDRITHTETEQKRMAQIAETAFVGTAKQVSDRLHTLYNRLQLDELVVVTWTFDPAIRRRSYELLAAEMI